MSLAIEGPLAKRPESDPIPTTEQPEPKRPKIGDPQLPVDTAMDLQSDSGSDYGDEFDENYYNDLSFGYCLICRKMVSNHTPEECPKKSRGFGIYCFVCEGPCKSSTDEHKGDQKERIKSCRICGSQGRHWTQDCPFSDDSEDEC